MGSRLMEDAEFFDSFQSRRVFDFEIPLRFSRTEDEFFTKSAVRAEVEELIDDTVRGIEKGMGLRTALEWNQKIRRPLAVVIKLNSESGGID